MKNIINVIVLGLFVTYTAQTSSKPAPTKGHYTDKLLYGSLFTTVTGLAAATYVAHCGQAIIKKPDKLNFLDKCIQGFIYGSPFGMPVGSGAVGATLMIIGGLSGTIAASAIKYYKRCKKKDPTIVIQITNLESRTPK